MEDRFCFDFIEIRWFSSYTLNFHLFPTFAWQGESDKQKKGRRQEFKHLLPDHSVKNLKAEMDEQPLQPGSKKSLSARPFAQSDPDPLNSIHLEGKNPALADEKTETQKELMATEETEITAIPLEGYTAGNFHGIVLNSQADLLPELNDFRLLKKLGEGAMGAVYKAHQISAERDVAVKLLFPHMAKNPKTVERFYREARTLGLLDHPNIVQAFGVGEENGFHYLAMEYVNGRSLQKWLNLLGKLSVGDALHITLACARALKHAHDLELVHRDIKPDNVLITRAGLVKVADFGMVKLGLEDMSLTQTGHGVGTPCYMPLEQARNAKESDGRCDIYALGCTLYCLLTGRPPFNEPTLVELIQAKERGTFSPTRRFNPEVPERLDFILLKMIAKKVDNRYSNCSQVINDLEALDLANNFPSFIPQSINPSETPLPAAISKQKGNQIRLLNINPSPVSEKISGDWWYVRYRTNEGQVVTRKMTTSNVLILIEDENFIDLKARACRTLNGTYFSLASIREFQDSMLARSTRNGVDQQTTRYRSRYQKLLNAYTSGRDERQVKDQQEERFSTKRRWTLMGGIFGAGSIIAFLIARFLILQIIAIFK